MMMKSSSQLNVSVKLVFTFEPALKLSILSATELIAPDCSKLDSL